MKPSDLDALMSAYAAQGGTIHRVAPGTRTMSEKQVYALAHGNDEERSEYQVRPEWDDSERITEVIDHCGRSHFKNAEGEWLS